MPTIYSQTSDGVAGNNDTTDAATCRGNSSTSGGFARFTDASAPVGIYITKSPRASGMWFCHRSFFEFVLTGETAGQTVESCDLKIYMDNLTSAGVHGSHQSVIAVEATAPLTSNGDDYGSCFTDTASPPTLGVTMTAATAISTTAGYHTFAITGDTSTGGIKVINDAIAVGKPCICLMDYTWDYLNADIGGTYGTSEYIRHQVYYAEDTSGSKDPYLDITYTSGVTVTYNATFFGANF